MKAIRPMRLLFHPATREQIMAPTVPTHPERQLALAVIEQALEEALMYTGTSSLGRYSHKQLARRAHEWISSRDAGSYSFEMLCEHLSINPQHVRRAIWRLYPIPKNESKLRRGDDTMFDFGVIEITWPIVWGRPNHNAKVCHVFTSRSAFVRFVRRTTTEDWHVDPWCAPK